MGEKIQVQGCNCVPCAPHTEYDSSGKVTWSVEVESLQLLLSLRWAAVQEDGSQASIKSLTQIKDPRFVYTDTDNKLLVVVEGTQPLSKVVSSSGQRSVTNSYKCEVCHKFEGDGKAMRQHQGGHDLQTKEEWMELYGKMKPDFPCMLCGIRESHGVNPNKNPNDMQGCHMWFSNSKATQADHFCKLVRETRLYGSSGVAGKSRWKSASWTNSWKDSKVPEPSSNIPMRCPFPGCNEVFWKQYLRKHIHKKHGNSTTFTPDYSTMSMFPHEHDYVKRLFENPGQPLTSICPKKNANSPDECDCPMASD